MTTVSDFEYPCSLLNSGTAVAHRLACVLCSGGDFAKSVVFPLGSLGRPLNLQQLAARARIPYDFLLLAVLQSLWSFGRRNDPMRESMDGNK